MADPVGILPFFDDFIRLGGYKHFVFSYKYGDFALGFSLEEIEETTADQKKMEVERLDNLLTFEMNKALRMIEDELKACATRDQAEQLLSAYYSKVRELHEILVSFYQDEPGFMEVKGILDYLGGKTYERWQDIRVPSESVSTGKVSRTTLKADVPVRRKGRNSLLLLQQEIWLLERAKELVNSNPTKYCSLKRKRAVQPPFFEDLLNDVKAQLGKAPSESTIRRALTRLGFYDWLEEKRDGAELSRNGGGQRG